MVNYCDFFVVCICVWCGCFGCLIDSFFGFFLFGWCKLKLVDVLVCWLWFNGWVGWDLGCFDGEVYVGGFKCGLVVCGFGDVIFYCDV